MNNNLLTKEEYQTDTLILDEELKKLILHNDNYNTFDFVINALIKIFKLDLETATQIAFITHYKGRCTIKEGTYDYLKPYKTALIDMGLNATIE